MGLVRCCSRRREIFYRTEDGTVISVPVQVILNWDVAVRAAVAPAK